MNQPVELVGRSAAALALREEVGYAAQCHAKVLITGESGVGKEVVTRMIHQRSARSRGPLVTINCAGVPDSLLESELFGHVRGSFTDAHTDKRGLLEAANGGTVFLDEVGEMSPRMQVMLLRFLETGEIQRVGSDRALPPLDVRVVTATHRRLLEHVKDKTFREDLYYRLNVIHIAIPPLRERRDDVEPLLQHSLSLFARAHNRPEPVLTEAALASLIAYAWPGNVRELRNVCERLVLQRRTEVIDVEMLPAEICGLRPHAGPAHAPAQMPVAQQLFKRLVDGNESFWSGVYEPFMARDLTRRDLRELIRLGLEHTRGNYKQLISIFNIDAADYKRFLNFLRKYECHVRFQAFRMIRTGVSESPGDAVRAAKAGSFEELVPRL
jgi:DNA-binding NtrC family response regulator